MSLEAVKKKIEEKEYNFLFYADQLNVQMKKGAVFTGWQEAPINFAPTYKYDAFSTEYDTSEKERIPAWCDRVLWLSGDKTVKNLAYSRHEFLQSDHRPVSAAFQVQIKSVVESKRKTVFNEIQQEFDKKENDSIPDAKVSTTELDFGVVHFGTPVTTSVVVENVGKVLVKWRFIPKLNETKPCKDWCYIQDRKSTRLNSSH